MSAAHDDDHPPLPPVDGQVGDWLDFGHEVTDADTLSPDGRRRAADLQLVHSLLSQSLRVDAVAKERRIQRVAARVQELSNTVTPAENSAPRPRRRWWAPVAIAAAVVMVAAMLRIAEPKQSALATVTASLQDAHTGSDRLYRVQLDWNGPMTGARELPINLWVHGGDRYVLRYQGALGEFVVGTNGTEHWVVPAVGPVVVGQQPGLLEQAVLGDQLSSPDLLITSVLDRMARKYDLALLPEVDVPDADGATSIRCSHVRGQLHTPDPLAPDTIELWAARNSGVAERLRLTWSSPTEERGLKAVTFELQPLTDPVATDWFEHATHHAADRRVIVRPSAGVGPTTSP
ncbi:hypothetical protein GC163_02275 [bacterium]|nr:hypothetical protein [bacterium]